MALRPPGRISESKYWQTIVIEKRLIFKRNTPQLAAAGIKGIRIQLRNGSACLIPALCGGGNMPRLLAAGSAAATLTFKKVSDIFKSNSHFI